MTVPDRGKLKGDVVLLDGDEVRAVPRNGRPRVLFNIFERGLVTDWTPRGIAWVGSEQRFVFHDLFAPFHATNDLVFFDAQGNLDRRVQVEYPAGSVITNVDGITWIPESSGVWPDHIVVTLIDGSFRPSYVVIDRNGAVVDQIFPDEPVASSYTTALAYASEPDRLVVSVFGSDDIYQVGFDGSVNGPFAPPMDTIESIALDRGHFVVASYTGEIVRTRLDFSASGRRIDAAYAPGMHRPIAVTHDGGEFAFVQMLEANHIAAMPDDYGSREHLVELTGIISVAGLTVVPGTGLYGTLAPFRRQLVLYDRGPDALLDPLDLSPAFPAERPVGVAYVEPTGQFLVRGSGGAPVVVEVGFDGLPQGEIDFGATLGVTAVTGVSWRATDDPLGQLLVLADGRLFVTDTDGNYLADHELPPFIGYVTAINDGVYAGEIAALEAQDTSRFFRFALP